ncbi:MAG: GNAT family N-acetyltransferase [Streptococcus sp.]|nr:GNAT family N-acetyltransferase [Streptococcus sp.]
MVRYYNYCPNCGCDKVESVTTSVTYLVCMNKDCRFAHIVEPPNSMGDKSREYTTTLSKEDWSKITKNIDVDEINNDSLTSFSSDDSVLDYTQIIKELVYKKDIDKEENNRYKDIWFKYKEEKISAYKYGYEKLKEVEDFAQEQGFQTISLHAQLGALKFYLNNGYQEVGNIFEEAGIQHITVEKSLISKKA